MSQDAEKVKRLVSLKQRLEKRVEELESEREEVQSMLDAVNSILLEKGFKRAEITKSPAEIEPSPLKEGVTAEPPASFPQAQAEYESVTALKTATGEILANLYVSGDSLRVVLAEDKNFDVNTPPFTHFLVGKVLAKMQEKDNELARTGQITPDKIFSYNIIREGDTVREITVRHVDQDRLRELKSSVRWTLEKMYEKMRSEG
jgi:hypothetical protein